MILAKSSHIDQVYVFLEEANIDLVEADCGSSCISPAVKRPSCLLVVEGENLDLSGDIGELASYQVFIKAQNIVSSIRLSGYGVTKGSGCA